MTPCKDYTQETMNPDIFRKIELCMGTKFRVDCLASGENKLCEIFITRTAGDGSPLVNFFTFITLQGPLWIFPPKSVADLAATHVAKYFGTIPFAFILHRFQEWPSAFMILRKLDTVFPVKLSSKTNPATAIPVPKRNDECWHPYMKLNRKPYETYAMINIPKNFRPRTHPAAFGSLQQWLADTANTFYSYSQL